MKNNRGKRWMAFLFVGLLVVEAVTGLRVQAASPKYLIKVNRQANCVTVYTKDENGDYTVPYKAMTCSTGGDLTPLGTYKVPARYRWRALVEHTWGQYATRISGPYLFHSVPYDDPEDPSTMLPGEFNKLGEAASHGCIRLTVEDSKWIYDNIAIGTTVIIYDDEDPGPLGKPEVAKLGEVDNWDPTDVWSEGNPYLDAQPEITVDGILKVTAGETEVDYLSGVTATSSTGEDITWKVQVNGTEDIQPDKPGIYRLVYEVTDGISRSTERIRFIRVMR